MKRTEILLVRGGCDHRWRDSSVCSNQHHSKTTAQHVSGSTSRVCMKLIPQRRQITERKIMKQVFATRLKADHLLRAVGWCCSDWYQRISNWWEKLLEGNNNFTCCLTHGARCIDAWRRPNRETCSYYDEDFVWGEAGSSRLHQLPQICVLPSLITYTVSSVCARLYPKSTLFLQSGSIGAVWNICVREFLYRFCDIM